MKGALPSVRELAEEFGASPQTVHNALRVLAVEGVVHALPRKGFFWGSADAAETGEPGATESADDRLKERFLSDLRHGVHHPWKELPSRKALAQVYGSGERRMGRILDWLTQRGALERRGRGYFLSPLPRRAGQSSVVVVVRCDVGGELLLETEREIDFMKSVGRECIEQGLGLFRVGYCEGRGGMFLDSHGCEIDPARFPGPILGALVSTWLVVDPDALLRRLGRLRIPLSVWWEHAAEAFPRIRHDRGLLGFNLSFGVSAGLAVGRHLGGQGCLDVAFLSPFHANEWSPARLQGLREGIEAFGGRVEEWVDDRFESPWQMRDRGGGEAGMRKLVRDILADFLESEKLRAVPTWVMVNDLAAVEAHRLLRARSGRIPQLIGFDNSSDSERIGFDSFEFHTDGMVRQMLHHIFHPKATLFAGPRVHEMFGRLVVRETGMPKPCR